jgi:N utilization substance protein B
MADYHSDYNTFDPDSQNVTHREVLEHPPASTLRSQARMFALQVMYEVDTTQHTTLDVIERNLEHADPKLLNISDYIHHLVNGTYRIHHAIDRILQEYAPEWPLAQVAVIDRNILRLALFEIVFEDRTPTNVVVDEAVWLARLFGADGTIRFVNGVLGAITSNLETVSAQLKQAMVITSGTRSIDDASEISSDADGTETSSTS